MHSPWGSEENQSNFPINIHYCLRLDIKARFIALCPANILLPALLSPELCADCRHCQHAFNCKTVCRAPDFPQLSPLHHFPHTHTHTDFSGLCAPVLHGNFMKSFHTISYVRASTQQVFIASACLKVPSQKARNSKLFFHCYQLPATQ